MKDSVTPARIKENADIFGFKIDKDDMEKMNSMDKGPKGRTCDLSEFWGWPLYD